MSTRITLRLDFSSGSRLGPGKVALLDAIARTGSISAAGREFGMAYRRAWLLVAELNGMFTGPLVATREGGRNGGGASLTPLGEEIVTLYRSCEAKTARAVAPEQARLEALLAPVSPPAEAGA